MGKMSSSSSTVSVKSSCSSTTPIQDDNHLTKITIPFHMFGPRKPLAPQIDDDEIHMTEDMRVSQPRVVSHKGNKVDKLLNSDTIGYFKEDFTPGATLVLLPHEEVKKIMLNPRLAPKDACNLVIIKRDGSLHPGFLPDFADFALLPKPFKIALKWMFENSDDTPPELKKLWLSVGPRLPTVRHETVIHYGFTRFKCHSFPSRLHIFKIPSPSKKNIRFDVECKDVSSSTMDGRKFKFELYVNPKENLEAGTEKCDGVKYEVIDRPVVNIMVWNCLGMGRPSFLGNLQHLIGAHGPDIVVVLESRISRHLLHTLVRDAKLYKVVGISPAHVYGGVAVLSRHNKVQFALHHRNKERIEGCVKGMTMLGY